MNLTKKFVSAALTCTAVLGLSVGTVAATAGSASAQTQESTHTLLPTGKKENEFVKRVHEAHIHTNLSDKQLGKLGRELYKFILDTAWSGTSDFVPSTIKDDNLGINSLEAIRIARIWWDIYL